MTIGGSGWTLEGKPKDFHQRFEATITADRIDAAWMKSDDGETWSKDFPITYSRIGA